jgi:hypothetical protein
MQTFTGKVVDLSRFDEDDVCIEDIAHALSNIVRFTGHAKAPYTVAQHSVMVSMLSGEHALCGLLHDATEAYLGDVSSPLKSLLPDYREAEERAHKVIAGAFGLPYPLPREVKDADRQALLIEKRDLLTVDLDWGMGKAEGPASITRVLPHDEAKQEFLSLYRELTGTA